MALYSVELYQYVVALAQPEDSRVWHFSVGHCCYFIFLLLQLRIFQTIPDGTVKCTAHDFLPLWVKNIGMIIVGCYTLKTT